jgi:putative sigma-54 modulation protein
MQVKIAARHGHLSEQHQAQIAEKAEKLLQYFDRITMIEVTVDFSKDAKSVELRVDAEHKHDFVAIAENGDLMSALSAAMDKMKQQIRHYKERKQDHRRDPSHGGPDGIKP